MFYSTVLPYEINKNLYFSVNKLQNTKYRSARVLAEQKEREKLQLKAILAKQMSQLAAKIGFLEPFCFSFVAMTGLNFLKKGDEQRLKSLQNMHLETLFVLVAICFGKIKVKLGVSYVFDVLLAELQVSTLSNKVNRGFVVVVVTETG